MGLFDQILGTVLSGVGGQTPAPAQSSQAQSSGAQDPEGGIPAGTGTGAGALAQMLLAAIAHEGGIGGLMQKFQSAGLGGTMASWIGTGANQPVSPASLQQVLDPAMVQAIGAKTGLPVEQLMAQISQHLPQMVDGLTPNGQAPGNNEALLQAGMALLKNRFGIG